MDSRQLGRGWVTGKSPPCPRGDRDSLTDSRAGFGPSSRSPRAERWRRRKRRRRRGRCSQHGQEPCQENTTSQLSPSIPAAVRTVTGPPALLPPLSPHLGPIVWLGAPGGGGLEGRGYGGNGERKRGGETRRKRGVGFVLAAEGEGRKGRGALR